jgi:aerobic-type carbon monoxide dehydrogenase small subunit (CoxS/CutS family)
LGRIACTVNGVRREAEVEPRLLIGYFLRESLGLTNIVKAIQSAAGTMRARPVLEKGEAWRKDRSQARPRLSRALSAR